MRPGKPERRLRRLRDGEPEDLRTLRVVLTRGGCGDRETASAINSATSLTIENINVQGAGDGVLVEQQSTITVERTDAHSLATTGTESRRSFFRLSARPPAKLSREAAS